VARELVIQYGVSASLDAFETSHVDMRFQSLELHRLCRG
jgi:hypothetical protein